MGDEGTIVYGAQRVSEGAIPGRDFLEVMGPATFYWLALFFKVFGTGWQVTRIYLLLTGLFSLLMLFDIARQVCRRSVAIVLWLFFLVMSIPLWPAISHHWDSNLFCFLAVWCFLKIGNHPGAVWPIAAGALAGIASCFMQQKGVYLFAAFLVSVIVQHRHDWRLLSLITAAYAAVGVTVLTLFWQAGALHDLVYANVIWPLSGYHGVNELPYGSFLTQAAWGPAIRLLGQTWKGIAASLLSSIPFLILAGLPLFAVASVSARLFARETRRRWLSSPLFPITLSGAALWTSEMHRKDIFHFAYGAPVLMIGLFATLDFSRKNIPFQTPAMGLLALSLALFGTLNLASLLRSTHMIETRRGVVRSTVDDDALRFLCTSVPRRESVFVYPYFSLYYYLADVTNPTRFSLLLYGYNTPAQFDEVIHNLEEKKVRYVLWDSSVYGEKLVTWFPGYRHPRPADLKLENYLTKTYQEVSLKNGFRVLERRSPKSSLKKWGTSAGRSRNSGAR